MENDIVTKRPFLILIVLACLLFTGCQTTVPTPTPFVPTQAALVTAVPGQPTTAMVETDRETAVMPTNPPLLVLPTPTGTPVPMPTLPPTPVDTQFHHLRFVTEVGAAPQDTFPVGANGIVALWDYTGMNPGDFVQRDWKFNGARWLYREEVWDKEIERGANGTVTDVVLYGEVIGGLAAGDYYLDLFVNGVWQTGGGFTVLPRPTEEEPGFNNLYFTRYANGPAQTSFPAGTEQVYAVWNYKNIGVSDVVKREWLLNGELWQTREETWDYFHYGPDGVVSDVSVYNFEGGGLSPGHYGIAIYLNGEKQLEDSFIIEP
ncbi:MAG: hypothetical protein CSA11_07105 [Chloroflexi bacterium]|nr:MAG: hypothetical protein CSA11_07105 [Chloroflexota bacterium]